MYFYHLWSGTALKMRNNLISRIPFKLQLYSNARATTSMTILHSILPDDGLNAILSPPNFNHISMAFTSLSRGLHLRRGRDGQNRFLL